MNSTSVGEPCVVVTEDQKILWNFIRSNPEKPVNITISYNLKGKVYPELIEQAVPYDH